MIKEGLENIERAKNILRGESASPEDIWRLAKQLKATKQFGYARRLLSLARTDHRLDSNPELRTLLRQQHALCTYKDQDLSADIRYDRALEILGDCDDLKKTVVQETLGIAGAIYKNKWETFAQKQDLERSLYYYLRGYRE